MLCVYITHVCVSTRQDTYGESRRAEAGKAAGPCGGQTWWCWWWVVYPTTTRCLSACTGPADAKRIQNLCIRVNRNYGGREGDQSHKHKGTPTGHIFSLTHRTAWGSKDNRQSNTIEHTKQDILWTDYTLTSVKVSLRLIHPKKKLQSTNPWGEYALSSSINGMESNELCKIIVPISIIL